MNDLTTSGSKHNRSILPRNQRQRTPRPFNESKTLTIPCEAPVGEFPGVQRCHDSVDPIGYRSTPKIGADLTEMEKTCLRDAIVT